MRYKTYNINSGFKKAKRKISVATMGLVALAFPAVIALSSGGASAVAGYTTFGDATVVPGGNPGNAMQLTSDATPGWGGINFNLPSGTVTFADISSLMTDYNITNDQCGAGSPRFQLETATGNIFVYLGPSPSFTGCAPGWQSSGELVGNNDACRYDTSQLSAGTQCNTYAGALGAFGAVEITGISLVVDSGWNADASVGDGEQTVLVDNVKINSDTYTFEAAPTVKVTIDKFVDSAMATSTTANSSAFPMVSSWVTTNIGSGSGSYSLSTTGFNSPNAYEAVTSDMNQGANYTTNEVTGGPVVAAACTPGGAPYALVGYTTGDSLAAAQAATPTTAVPAFTNIQADKFVIVWNTTCPTAPVFAHPSNKDACKNDGWKSLYDDNNRVFKNQGDCVSYVATHGKNKANG